MESTFNDRLQLALNASNEGVWDWYVDKDAIFYSDKALDILGFSQGDAPNIILQAEKYLHPDDFQNFQTSLHHILENNGDDILAIDARYKKPDNSWNWLRIRGVVVRNDAGAPIRMVGSLTDISKRKIAEEALAEEKHKLHQLVENIPVNIYYKDTESRFVFANTSTAKKLGVDTVEELMGKTDHDFFDKHHADIARANELEIMRSKRPQMNLIERETWDNKEDTWGETCKIPWLDSQGNVQGIFGITSDITQLVQTQRQLTHVAEELHARNEAMEEEIKLAREIQQALIPQDLEKFTLQSDNRKVQLSYRYKPASDMAGDFFEVMPISENQLGVLICDVMGHGVRSSLIVSMLRGLIEKERDAAVHPEWFMYGINDGLVSILERANVTLFATAIYCVIDLKKETLQYTTAGHHSPIILKDGKTLQLKNENKAAPALGLIPQAPYTSQTLSLDDVDRILLFTDGLYEIENEQGQQLEISEIGSMMEQTHDMDLDSSLDFIVKQAKLHSKNGQFDDDLCLLGLNIQKFE